MTDLTDFAEAFFRHRDIVKKDIESVTRTNGALVILKKSGTQRCAVQKELHDSDAEYIVCLQTAQNVTALFRNWKTFSARQGQTIIFANPKLANDNTWLIKPAVHERICDPKSLRQGIFSMAETVPYL